jgi:hypothetical protein
MPVEFEQEIKVISYRTIEIPPGTYYAKATDEDGEWTYYKFTVRAEDYDILQVKNGRYKKRLFSLLEEYAPTWKMQEIFADGKDTEHVPPSEFDKELNAVVAHLFPSDQNPEPSVASKAT